MNLDPPIPKYYTSDPTSFAFTSARSRWPSILTGAIDDVHRTVSSLPESEVQLISDGKAVVSAVATLKYEVQHNRALSALPVTASGPGDDDIPSYNAELSERGTPPWHDVEWLYAECYLYRRIATIVKNSPSKFWQDYDVFQRQKMSTFKSSRPAVLELARRYRELVTQIDSSKSSSVIGEESDALKVAEAEKVLFMEMAEICLWGNATDLSLLTNLTYEDIQKLQGGKARKEAEKNVLVNDLGKAFDVLNQAKREGKESRRVDIVLDNAGFELFVDLILAGYLIRTELATEVVLHPKSVPWFVSDVVPKDFGDLLNAMADPKSFYEKDDREGEEKAIPLTEAEVEDVKFLFDDWAGLHSEGNLILRPSAFWTHPGSFWRMPKTAPDLVADLKHSELVIYKGDLNYRKLTGDVSGSGNLGISVNVWGLTMVQAAWDPTSSFEEAIGPLGRGSQLRTLALRTCKADVVVGLPNGKDEELRQMPGGGGDTGERKWAWSGKWAVVQFYDGKNA